MGDTAHHETTDTLIARLHVLSRAASVFSVGIGLLVLFGWIAHIPILTSVVPGLSTMKVSTASCFALCGVSLWFRLRPASFRTTSVAAGAAVIVVIIAALTLLEYGTGFDLAIDRLLVIDRISTTGIPGRMGVNTASCFVLLGASLVLLNTRHVLAQALALGATGVAGIALLGYLYSAPGVGGLTSSTQMALHTAMTLVVLGTGVASVHARRGAMGILTSNGPGGALSRRLVPAVFAGPVLLGWFRLLGERAGWYDTELGVALLTISTISVLSIVAASLARRLDRADATERTARQTADVASERLAALVALSDDAIIGKDLNGIVTSWNIGAERLFGYAAREMVGASILRVIPPDCEAEERDILERIQRGERVQQLETVRRTKDGRLRDVSITVSPIPDALGAIVGASTVARDITDRKQAIEALRTTEERMRFALESAEVGIWDIDYATGVLRWSETIEAHYGLAPGTFEGTFDAFVERVHPEDRASLLETIDAGMRSGSDFSTEHRSVWPDGTVHWITGAGRVRLDEQGQPIRGVGISLDTTERRMLEAQFQQAQKMEAVGRLAGGVAHDFNNLLTAILGYCELLTADLGPDDAHLADITEIQKAGVSAAGLTRQLLAFSRKQIINPTLIDLNAVVNGMQSLLGRLIGEDIQIVRALQPALALVRADRGQVEQVIMNLAVNARDAMPGGGLLTLETANVDLDEHYVSRHFAVMPGTYVALTVTDTGAGITPQVQARLFEPFFTTKDVGKGTGLGLAMVHGVVTRAGGSVNVYSEVGQGTSFKVYFPAADATEMVVDAPPPSARPRAGGETVLVVEDSDGLRELAKRLLVRQGYTVLAAANAEEALRLFAQHPSIDVILTDIVMPGASGPELTKQLIEQRPALRVIYMSGYTEEAIVQHGVLKSGIAFLDKPFNSETLGQKIREVLDR